MSIAYVSYSISNLAKCELKSAFDNIEPFLDLRGQYYFRRGIPSNRPLITSVIKVLVLVFEFIIADWQLFALVENTLHVVGNP